MDGCTDTHIVSFSLLPSSCPPLSFQRNIHTQARSCSIQRHSRSRWSICSVQCARSQKARCDLQGTPFRPPNLVCNPLSTTTVWFHHAWPGTREQLLDEKLWQLSLSGRRPSQWEPTAGNVIATLSYYSNARTENTKWIACPQWLPSYSNTLYAFEYFCGSSVIIECGP